MAMKVNLSVWKAILKIFWGFFVLAFIAGCQEDPFPLEKFDPGSEKSGVLQSVPMSGTLSNGALYEICLPEMWNILPAKVMIVYAHGYRDADKSLILPVDSILVTSEPEVYIGIREFIMNQGIGYASTSYRANGLIVPEAVEDIVLLRETIDAFFATHSEEYDPPEAIVLVGPSEGGLVTVLTIEQNPGLFNAAIATCCPIGDFYKQLQYYGDAHVLFKYFFGPSIGGINLGSPKGVSKRTMDAWNDESLTDAISDVLEKDFMYNEGRKVIQFVACANIPVDFSDPYKVGQAILEVLRFPVKATNDAIYRLEGNPYNNKFPRREYSGSFDDRKLNLTVERIMRHDWQRAAEKVTTCFETSGVLMTPLITMHTEFDHVSFFEHQVLYQGKVSANSPYPEILTQIPVMGRYGHCTFTASELGDVLSELMNMLYPLP